MADYHTSSRRMGRFADMVKHLADALRLGETILIADVGINNRDQIIHILNGQHGIRVDCEQVMSTTPMRIVYDVYDTSPEPGFTFDFGHEVRFGYKLKMKTDGTTPQD